jgi:hypothetical protein
MDIQHFRQASWCPLIPDFACETGLSECGPIRPENTTNRLEPRPHIECKRLATWHRFHEGVTAQTEAKPRSADVVSLQCCLFLK